MSKSLISTGIKAVKASSRLIPSKVALTLTPSAVERVKELMSKNAAMKGLRVGVKQRGCNGFTYTLEYATDKKKFDEVVETSGIKIFIDAKAQMSILGTEMDFIRSDLASEFVFHNPNIKGTCGCGESFNV